MQGSEVVGISEIYVMYMVHDNWIYRPALACNALCSDRNDVHNVQVDEGMSSLDVSCIETPRTCAPPCHC